MAEANTPVLDTLLQMNEGVLERSGLDGETFMLVRIAALAATGAPPASYLVNLKMAEELGVDPEQVQGVLVAVAPVIGGAAVAAAASAMTARSDCRSSSGRAAAKQADARERSGPAAHPVGASAVGRAVGSLAAAGAAPTRAST